MAKEKKYKVVIDFDNKKITKDISKALTAIDKFTNDTTKKVGKTEIAWGSFVGSVASNALTSGISAARTAVVGFLNESIQLASDAEETLNKFNVVFADVRDEADRTANNLATNFGLSSAKAKELLSDTGDLLTGFGFTGQAALDLSRDVNELAVDLASFTNFSGGAEGASRALTKALLGERESIKSLGISILEEDVKMQVLKNTQNDMTFASERQAKAYATLQIATSQSKNAIGDFERSMGSNVNQSRILDSRLETLKTRIGTELLPAVIKIKQAFIQWLDELDTEKIISFTNSAVELFKNFDAFKPKIQSLRDEIAMLETDIALEEDDFFVDDEYIEKKKEKIRELRTELNKLSDDFGTGDFLARPDEDPFSEIPGFKKQTDIPLRKEDKKTKETNKTKTTDNENEAEIEKENEFTVRLAGIKRERKALMDEMDEEFRADDLDKLTGFEAEKIRIQAEQQTKMIDLDESFKNAKDAKDAIQAKKELDLIKLKAKKEEEIEKQKNDKLKQDKQRFFQDAISLTNSKSGELVAIGRAAALTNIAMDTEEAVSGAYAWGTTIGGPPLGIAFGAIAAAAQAQRAANVAGIQGFETGGVIMDGGDSGDNTLIRANRKERVLTDEQNRAFEELVFNGNRFGTNDTNSLLLEINSNLRANKNIYIDGEEISDRLEERSNRRLK